jgi:hypothetical protein
MPSMTRLVLISLAVFSLPRAAADEAREVVTKAIQAHGGEARLARTTRGRVKAKVDGFFGARGSVKATWEEVFDLPQRYRRTLDGTNAGMPFHEENGVNGKRGWMRQGQGTPQDVLVAEPLPLGDHWHAVLAQLLLLRDKDARLTYLGEEQQGGRTLLGVRVGSPQTQANVYFDKSTGLLARARRPLPNMTPGREMIGETIYDDYRDVGGVKYPMHMRAMNGDTFSLNIVVTALEFLDKIDDASFTKPEAPRPAQENAESGGQEGKDAEAASIPAAEPPPRWDHRLIAATLVTGAFIAVVWLIARNSRKRERPTLPQ